MDNSQASEVTKQDSPPELISRWYERPDNQGQSRWSIFNSDKEDFADLLARTSNTPIIHRFARKGDIWETDSITIQDPHMRKVLGDVLKMYPDLDLKKENWTFRPPFQPLLHRWNRLEGYSAKAKANPATEHAFSGLLSFLAPIIKGLPSSSKKVNAADNIDFTNIRHILPPGTLIFSKEHDAEIVSRVLKCEKCMYESTQNKTWNIDVEHVDWDGKECGYRECSFTIDKFDGYCRVTELDVFPISYLEDETKFRAAFIERGRKFEQLGGYKFMTCCKKTKIWDSGDKRWRIILAGSKICVDAFAYYDNQNINKPKLRPLDGNGKHPVKDGTEKSETASGSLPAPSVRRKEHLQPLTDEQRLMIHPWLRCFDLQTRKWCKVLINDLEEATSDDLAFEKLLLPDNEKEALLNLVRGKLLSSNLRTNDFIQNQDRSLICLMCGPSGVGKTFTAKAIADKLRLPLFSMLAEDLGGEPSDIEKPLKRAMELCRLWDAIFLLEEADFLLAARDNQSDEKQDEFVTTFLRMLETYTGILFLTTNKASSIDSAFQSLINHFQPYSPLGIQVRRQIWRDFIEHPGKDNFICSSENMDDVLSELSKYDLNGYEIKNLVQSARMIALGSEKNDNKIPLDTLCLLAHNRVQSLRP
ncbi:P-loop containing nucleoside triphosphate hydrolase protein [Daldinia loculata]|nr:P-loop containing nucleoside triphosphate hydrolase protein [Daldinia loculata]